MLSVESLETRNVVNASWGVWLDGVRHDANHPIAVEEGDLFFVDFGNDEHEEADYCISYGSNVQIEKTSGGIHDWRTELRGGFIWWDCFPAKTSPWGDLGEIGFRVVESDRAVGWIDFWANEYTEDGLSIPLFLNQDVEPDMPGDVNGDGHLAPRDLLMALNAYLDKRDLDQYKFDVDGDGHVATLQDVEHLLELLVMEDENGAGTGQEGAEAT